MIEDSVNWADLSEEEVDEEIILKEMETRLQKREKDAKATQQVLNAPPPPSARDRERDRKDAKSGKKGKKTVVDHTFKLEDASKSFFELARTKSLGALLSTRSMQVERRQSVDGDESEGLVPTQSLMVPPTHTAIPGTTPQASDNEAETADDVSDHEQDHILEPTMSVHQGPVATSLDRPTEPRFYEDPESGAITFATPFDIWYTDPKNIHKRAISKDDYEGALQLIGSFDSLEEFFEFQNSVDWNNMPDGSVVAYCRKGVKPQWEDIHNCNGGRFILKKIRYIEAVFTHVALGFLSGMLTDWSNYTCASLHIRSSARGPDIQLWHRGPDVTGSKNASGLSSTPAPSAGSIENKLDSVFGTPQFDPQQAKDQKKDNDRLVINKVNNDLKAFIPGEYLSETVMSYMPNQGSLERNDTRMAHLSQRRRDRQMATYSPSGGDVYGLGATTSVDNSRAAEHKIHKLYENSRLAGSMSPELRAKLAAASEASMVTPAALGMVSPDEPVAAKKKKKSKKSKAKTTLNPNSEAFVPSAGAWTSAKNTFSDSTPTKHVESVATGPSYTNPFAAFMDEDEGDISSDYGFELIQAPESEPVCDGEVTEDDEESVEEPLTAPCTPTNNAKKPQPDTQCSTSPSAPSGDEEKPRRRFGVLGKMMKDIPAVAPKDDKKFASKANPYPEYENPINIQFWEAGKHGKYN